MLQQNMLLRETDVQVYLVFSVRCGVISTVLRDVACDLKNADVVAFLFESALKLVMLLSAITP